jgi:hypothetical protein
MTSSWTVHPLLASRGQRAAPWSDTVVQRQVRGIFALGPRWVRATTVQHGHQRSPAVTDGSDEPQIIDPPGQAAGMMHEGDSDCAPEGPVGVLREAAGRYPR